jgi:predicted transcriptional regulator
MIMSDSLLDYTAQIVSSHVSNNATQADAVTSLIQSVYQTLAKLGSSEVAVETVLQPAVPIKKSVFADHIVCLEDGKKLKMLKRHLQTAYGMTPDEYRAKWGLPSSYPMVAPDYSERRSGLAKSNGLGQSRAPAAAAAEVAAPAPKTGRRKVL